MDCNNIYKFPAYHHGHTMDILISRDTSTLLTDIEVENINLCNDDGDLIRDHYSIECTIQQSTPLQNREIVSYRNVKQIDNDQFCKNVSELPTLYNIQGTVNELVDVYILRLRALLDKHIPIMHRVVTVENIHRDTQSQYVMQNVVEGDLSIYGGMVKNRLTS